MTEKKDSLDDLLRRADRYLRWSIVVLVLALALQIAALLMRCR